MAKRDSIFAQDWRDCLEEHYKDVVQRNDQLTEKTLTGVLHDVGFREDELRQLKLMATMRAEDLQDDFVPNLDVSADEAPAVFAGVDVPVAEVEANALEVQPDDAEAPLEDDEKPDEPDPDSPQQMSMF